LVLENPAFTLKAKAITCKKKSEEISEKSSQASEKLKRVDSGKYSEGGSKREQLQLLDDHRKK
jgi:hypothetical protein